jgi:xanthine/uracil permease
MTMDRKPDHIIYGRDEKPPLRHLLVLSFQHALIPLMFLTFPILVARELELSFGASVEYLSTCILALGVGTLIQCSRNAIGSGTLAVHQSSPIFLPVFLLAAKSGGLGVSCFLTFLAGATQVGLSRVLVHLKKIFTEEVCGVAIFMLGISMVPSAVKLCFGLDRPGLTPQPLPAVVAGATLLSIVVTSTFFRQNIRFYSLFIGCGCGYLLCWLTDLFPPGAWSHLRLSPWISLPHLSLPQVNFQAELILVFVICAVISSIDTLGGMISIDKMNHAEWKKQDIRLSARGVQASGFNNLIAGLMGAYPNGVSSSNIGLSFATAVTSRYVGIGAGMIIMLLAFLPKLLALLSIIPRPVTGAILMYASAFLICAGIDLIMVRSLNPSKVFIVGFSIIGGIASGSFPLLADPMPAWLGMVFRSQLAVSTLLAIGLTAFFRLGQARRMGFPFVTGKPFDARKLLESFIARVPLKRDLFNSAYMGLNECLEAVVLLSEGKTVAGDITCSYSDSVLKLEVRYPGAPPDMAFGRPIPVEELGDLKNAIHLSFLLMRHYADRVQVESDGGFSTISLFFEE